MATIEVTVRDDEGKVIGIGRNQTYALGMRI